MRLLAAAIGVSLAVAAPAPAAETVGRGGVTAGPVLTGGAVLWADAPSGTPRVLSGAPSRRPVVVGRWPAARVRDTGRTVAALAAAGDRAAAVVETCTTTVDGDAVFLGCAERAFGGTPGGHFAPFGRPLPRRGPPGCSSPRAPVSVAAGIGVIAVAETPSCQGIARAAGRSRIVVHRGAARQLIPSAGATRLRMAGRYLAYLEGRRFPRGAVLYDLARRERVRRVSGSTLQAVDVQADGTLALLRSDRARTCVSVLRRGAAREQRVACGVAAPDVAIAGGRVLFTQGRRLVLARPGGRRRVLARPGGYGHFDLAPDRAAWTAGPPSGIQRIRVAAL